jgi:glutaredoxin
MKFILFLLIGLVGVGVYFYSQKDSVSTETASQLNKIENNVRQSTEEGKSTAYKSKRKSFIEIYMSAKNCSECDDIRSLLKKYTQKYPFRIRIYDVDNSDNVKREAFNRTGGQEKLPQVFINGQYMGGLSDLKNMDEDGRLARALSLK